MSQIALVDCNNFYCSAERVFNPAIEGKPVVVLSNNDGCIISRSNEAKSLGIKMAEPVYKVLPFLKKHRVNIYSSNYQLYGDMSHRVMTSLNYFVPEVDIYSIDECFINFDGFEHKGLTLYSQTIKDKIEQWTGIPVAIGIGANKVMAKLANHIAKKHKGNGVFQLKQLQEEECLMKQLPINEIWGIGRRSAIQFKVIGLETVWDFYCCDPIKIKQIMGIRGQELYYALHNQHNPTFEPESRQRKNIASSRSFSKLVTDLISLEQALSNYVMIASQKLRRQKSYTQAVQVYLSTNPFQKNQPQYHNSIAVTLANPSNDSCELIRIAKNALRKIYQKGFFYHKVGVILLDLSSNKQLSLFAETNDKGREKLMKVMDGINHKVGTDTVFIGAQGIKKHWLEKRQYLSKKYTTNWQELMEAG